jgi:hypothetical protein
MRFDAELASRAGEFGLTPVCPNTLENKAFPRDVVNTGEATRTPDLRFMRPQTVFRNGSRRKDLRQRDAGASHHIPTDNCQRELELTAVNEAWDQLPEAVRAGILAMVKAALN